ncbi:MAG: TlpA family protein disulfide reductase [Gammaproteobacteria bacterium]|nr:TlpA family protein disulfide reductase [Gammaproteobacteria bacterium]
MFLSWLTLVSPAVFSNELNDPDGIPHVGKRARDSYVSYLYADEHKAFAVGPGGAWAWQEGLESAEVAEATAIETCQEYTQQRCVAYAVNDKLVFDKKAWPTLWGPYLTKVEAKQAKQGNKRGQRFFDLLFKDVKGKSIKLSDYRGKVVFLHFWGSWCPSCMIEFPALERMQKQLEEKVGEKVALVILQAREDYKESRRWADQNGFKNMELFDSGSSSSNDVDFQLADGSVIPDRAVSKLFPSSYVLDKNGIVVFSHRGAIRNWLEYLAFFEDLVSADASKQKALQLSEK